MKKDLNRALNTFAAMDTLPESMVLEAENAALHERLAASEEERKELRQQVGMALSALQQEKQEKMLLLPAPRKTIAEKVKVFFSGHNKKGQENS